MSCFVHTTMTASPPYLCHQKCNINVLLATDVDFTDRNGVDVNDSGDPVCNAGRSRSITFLNSIVLLAPSVALQRWMIVLRITDDDQKPIRNKLRNCSNLRTTILPSKIPYLQRISRSVIHYSPISV
mmetsp:Transcript_29478/g.55804  ORF Transcript_29478/g.55804 Transcript_29478/m.55804 type:complete len:127 (-) Transcript_29478:461-841(-)